MTARTGLDRNTIGDSLTEQWGPRALRVGEGADGLPTPLLENGQHAPPLSEDTLVCLPDERTFVLRDSWGEVIALFDPSEVKSSPDGKKWVPLSLAVGRVQLSSGLSKALKVVIGMRTRILVQPIRPVCRHFLRQLTDFEGDDSAVMCDRACTARRDSQGEFIGLANTQVLACELRDPYDAESADRIKRFDEAKLQVGRERREAGEGFDLKKLDKKDDDELSGIFK